MATERRPCLYCAEVLRHMNRSASNYGADPPPNDGIDSAFLQLPFHRLKGRAVKGALNIQKGSQRNFFVS